MGERTRVFSLNEKRAVPPPDLSWTWCRPRGRDGGHWPRGHGLSCSCSLWLGPTLVCSISSLLAGVSRKTVCPQMGRGLAAQVPWNQRDTWGSFRLLQGPRIQTVWGSCGVPGPLYQAAVVLCAGLAPRSLARAGKPLADLRPGPAMSASDSCWEEGKSERQWVVLIANSLCPRGHFAQGQMAH